MELNDATLSAQRLVAARELAETMITRFQTASAGFSNTSDDHATLITRHRDLQDNATSSGRAIAVTALRKLAESTNIGVMSN